MVISNCKQVFFETSLFHRCYENTCSILLIIVPLASIVKTSESIFSTLNIYFEKCEEIFIIGATKL